MAAFYSDRLVEGTLDWTTATLAKWSEIFFEEFTFYLTRNYLKPNYFKQQHFTGRAILAVEYMQSDLVRMAAKSY